MNKILCDVCGKEIGKNQAFREFAAQKIVAYTGNVVEISLDVCKGCMKRSLRLLRKAAKREVAGDDGQE